MNRSGSSRSRAASLLWSLLFATSLLGCDRILGITDVEFEDGEVPIDAPAGTPDAPGPPPIDAVGGTDAGNTPDAAAALDASPPVGDWWDNDYPYRTEMTVTPPTLQAPLQDVPVLLAFSASQAPYIADTQEDGLRVVDDSDNPLNHEVERWNPAGTSYLWVRIPTMDSATPITLWLYYGGSGAGPQTDPIDVWRNSYLAVWHLQELVTDGQTNGTHLDTSGNDHHGAQNFNGPLVGFGAIGGAQEFDGTSDHIEVPAENGLESGYAQMTISARVQVQSNASISFSHVIGAGGNADEGRYRQVYWDRGTTGWSGRYRAAGDDSRVHSGAGQYNVWSVIATVYDGSEVRVYLDGQEVGTALALSGALSPINTFVIGGNPYLDTAEGGRREFDGYIDEVRVSTQARSDDWLEVQNESMNDALVTYGNTECLDACPP